MKLFQIRKKQTEGEYKGQMKNNERNGIGRMYYDNEEKYWGEWKDNKK